MGIFNWPDGSIYEGQWKQSRPHGYGTQYGTGTCLYSNGIMYTGEFKNNLRHGVGTCQWPDGSYYSGLWDNNEMRNPQDKTFGENRATKLTKTLWEVIK